MGFGVLLMVGGVGVSLGTFLFASAGSVVYVFWGVVVFGGILFFQSLAGWRDAGSHVIEDPDKQWDCPKCSVSNPNTSYVCVNCGESLL